MFSYIVFTFFSFYLSVFLCLSLSVCLSPVEDSPQENGIIQTQYSAISPPASPKVQDEPFSTYFEEKVPIPDDATQVRTDTGRFEVLLIVHRYCIIRWTVMSNKEISLDVTCNGCSFL